MSLRKKASRYRRTIATVSWDEIGELSGMRFLSIVGCRGRWSARKIAQRRRGNKRRNDAGSMLRVGARERVAQAMCRGAMLLRIPAERRRQDENRQERQDRRLRHARHPAARRGAMRVFDERRGQRRLAGGIAE